MNLYLITRHKNEAEAEWDSYLSHVIAAENESQVRTLAKKVSRGELEGFFDEMMVEEEYIQQWNTAYIQQIGTASTAYTQPQIIHSHYLHG